MHAYNNDRVHSPAAKLAERENLAALMAAFEAARGPIETLPIVRRTEQKRPMYNRGTSQAASKPPAIKQHKGGGKTQWHIDKRKQNTAIVQPLLEKGLRIMDIAAETGLSIRTVSRIANDPAVAA